jgi:signal transduction histidine kinase
MQETGRPLVIPSVEDYAGWVYQPATAWIKSYAGTPIHTRDQVHGFLNVCSSTPGLYSLAHAEHLQASASQAASAIENARLFAEVQHQLFEQTLLNECAQDLMLSRDLQTASAAVTERLLHHLDATAMCYYSYNEADGTIRADYEYWTHRATSQERQPVLGMVWPLTGYPCIATALQTGIPQILRRNDPKLTPTEREMLVHWDGQTVIAVPLIAHNRVLGYFEIWDSQIEREYDEADKRLLLAFATQTALAIEHVQLLETLEQRVAERTSELVNERDKLNVALKELAAARDQALAASRLKTELLAKVSHELRTPLAAILGLAEVLDLGVYGPISGKQQQTVAQIIDSAQYLTGLVNELLDQAQLEAGKLKLDMRPFAPADVLDHTVAKLSVLAQAKGLTLTAGMAADVPATLSGDPARVQQVLVNLVSNAIKFTQAGTVQVRLYRPDAIYWAMEVSDTGPGIPFEAQAYIFEPFRQVDGSMTRAHIGAGLGLSIVKQLTTLMGGQVTLESEVGRGSTFTVQLPLSPIQKRIP